MTSTFRPSLLIGMLPAALLALPSLNAEDWYRWRGPNLDGISRETTWSCDWPQGKATIAWRALVGIGYSSVVVADGLAYTIGHVDGRDVIHAIRVSDGAMQWQFEYPAALDDRDFEGGPTSTPTVDGDRVYVLSRAGELFCLGAKSGAQIWRQSIADAADVRLPGWGCAGAPLVVGNRLLLNVGESGVAVEKQTGALAWKSADRESGYATPVPIPDSDPPMAIFGSGKSYVAVEIESGTQRWSQRWLTSFNCNAADPIVHGDLVFLSSGYNRGAALLRLTDEAPEIIWKTKEMKNQIHTSILHQGQLFGIDGDMEAGARLRCMNWNSGEILWSEDELGPGGLALAGDRLIVLTQQGELIVAPASSQGWKPIASTKVLDGKCWTAPVISDGRIFCKSIQGELVCVDCRS